MIASKTYQTKNGLAALRLRLGLSQQAFAGQLGISRSLLGYAENHKRSLPTSALLRLAALEMVLHQQATQKNTKPACLQATFPIPHTSKKALMQQRIQTLHTSLRRRECELQRMLCAHGQAQQCLAQLDLLMTAGPAATGRFPAGALELHRYTLLRKLNKSGAIPQAHLLNRIEILQASLAAENRKAECLALVLPMELVA